MDPDAALNGLMHALFEEDYRSADEFASGLTHWIEKDGFLPGGNKLNKDCILGLCKFAQGMHKASAALDSAEEKQEAGDDDTVDL
jgi:hypothetical protein